MQKLIIYLPLNDSEQARFLLVDDSSVNPVNLETLPQLSEKSEVIVLIPAEEVLLTSVKLPQMNRSRLLDAIPYALEEQIIGDVESMHFVPDKQQINDAWPVAIILKEKMQYALDKLKIWNVQPDILMPAIFSMPVEENKWTLFLHEMAYVRMSAFQGFACDIANLEEMLSIAVSTTSVQPSQIHIHNFTRQPLQKFNSDIKEEYHDENEFFVTLAKNTLAFPYINLLQGAYKTRKSKFPEMKKLWKAVTVLSITCLVLILMYPLISLFILNHHMNSIDSGIEAIYKRHFPNATSIVSPKIRMQEKMKSFNGYASEGKWITLIAQVGKGMTEARGVNITRLDFQNNKMTMELTAASTEDFSTLTDYLTQQGLNVKQDNASLSGSRVNAIITVE